MSLFIVALANMGVVSFHGDFLSRIFLPRKSRQNKSHAKINRFTVPVSVFYFLLHKTQCVVVVLEFYSPSTLFRSFWVQSVNLLDSTLFLGKPPGQFNST